MDQKQLERIQERRQQIEAKLLAKRNGDGGANALNTVAQPARSKGEEQVRASRRVLGIKKVDADDAVSRYRLKTDTEENERRIRDELLQVSRARKIEDEIASTNHRKGAIQLNFEALYQIKIPQDLHREIELQKEACAKVIEVKDKLIDEFKSQLRDKEEEYVRALKDETNDIDALLAEMHTRTKEMVTAYRTQLEGVESAYKTERKEMLDAHEKELRDMVDSRREKEEAHKKRRDTAIHEGHMALDTKYLEQGEIFNNARRSNQTSIHKIATELEGYKAQYMMNAEKLNYNLQVLRERVKENKNAQNQHKRKLTRLQDVLSQLINRYAETDKRFRQANNELTEAYRRVTEQYKDLQLKFQHFEKADQDKHQQIWTMHENDCMKLVHKCMQGDRVVHEELLGMPWVPPSLDFWVHTEEDTSDAQGLLEGSEEAMTGEPLEISENAQLMLQILYTQAPFLVEEKAKDALRNLEQMEGTEAKLDNILSVLGIVKTEQVDELLEYFTVEADDEGGITQINPQDAVQALYTYLDERKNKAATRMELTNTQQTAASVRSRKQLEKRKAEREFWRRMASVVPEGHDRIWRSLEKGLEGYLAQLQQRSSLIDETDRIRKQNEELRALLNQYLGSRVNDELFSPPQLQVVPSARPGAQ